MEQFAKQEKVPIVTFEKGQRKDDVAAEYRKKVSAAGWSTRRLPLRAALDRLQTEIDRCCEEEKLVA